MAAPTTTTGQPQDTSAKTKGSASEDQKPVVNDPASVRRVGIFLFVLIGFLIMSLFLLFDAADGQKDLTAGLGRFTAIVTYEQVLMLAVLAAGALGGCIHVATSFGDYVGNNEYRATWQWWYFLRPAIGAALALVFYVLVRGGVLSLASGTDTAPSLFGMTAIAALVGMFSKQATDKLDDVFDTLFNSGKDAARKDSLNNPQPVLDDIEPRKVEAGSKNVKVTLKGSQFVADSVGRFAGEERPTHVVSLPTTLEVTLRDEDVQTPGTYRISVFTRGTGAGASRDVEFKVVERVFVGAGVPVAGSGASEPEPPPDQ